jgi:hypothetical protein
MVLGVLGPALFLIVVAFFALRVLDTAVKEFSAEATSHALSGNRFGAAIDAQAVAREISRRRDALERRAEAPRLVELLQRATDKGREQRQPELADLQKYLHNLRDSFQHMTHATRNSSWFLLDAQGIILGTSPLRETTRPLLGKKSFAYRSYFHGGPRDYSEEEMKALPEPLKPLTHFVQSSIIESTLDHRPIVVIFSVPVKKPATENEPETTVGVLGMSVEASELGEFLVKEKNPSARWAILVETRKDWMGEEGMILYHPYLEALRKTNQPVPRRHLSPDLIAQLGENREDRVVTDYQDPFQADDALYKDQWLAAYEPVVLDARGDVPEIKTGWAVIVQERAQEVFEPVERLRQRLVLQGVWALAAVAAILLGLWCFVVLVLNPPSRSRLSRYLRQRAGLTGGNSTSGMGTPHSLGLAGKNRPLTTGRETGSSVKGPGGG